VSEQNTVKVTSLPKCDFCTKLANYDGATKQGPWAYMCDKHFNQYGKGLGMGVGQRLILLGQHYTEEELDALEVECSQCTVETNVICHGCGECESYVESPFLKFKNKILAMKPGPELDALVVAKVMPDVSFKQYSTISSIPYSVDITAAHEIALKLNYKLILTKVDSEIWLAEFGEYNRNFSTGQIIGKTGAEAICKAALIMCEMKRLQLN